MPPLHILGINAAYHESAAVLLRGDDVVMAVEEERLTRVKHSKEARCDNPDALPWRSIEACLAAAGIELGDVDAIGFSMACGRRAATVGLDPPPVDEARGFGTAAGEADFEARLRSVPGLLARRAGRPQLESRFHFVPHHVAHGVAALYASPFDAPAVLVVDGIGEDATAWWGTGGPEGLSCLGEVPYPHSIGLLWERFSLYMGFNEHDAAKVMGLAAYGDADRFSLDVVFRVPPPDGDGPPFEVDVRHARFRSPDVAGLEALFGPRRRPDEAPEPGRFADLAAALQRRTEEALLALARRLWRACRRTQVTCAGGVALNCVANARLEREGPFDALHVMGASHDAGTALGAAVEAARRVRGRVPRPAAPLTPFLGPSYSEAEMEAAARAAGLRAEPVADAADEAAALLARGALVGWFQGALELGPRALGHRSLLADPRHLDTRHVLNQRVKHREPFRPFAASVLAEAVADWFEIPSDRPGGVSSRESMVLVYPARPERAPLIPAVLHRDGTCRLQSVSADRDPLYHRLLSCFHARSGVPMVLNTSFNDSEPIVCSPADAVRTFQATGIDALFLGRLRVS